MARPIFDEIHKTSPNTIIIEVGVGIKPNDLRGGADAIEFSVFNCKIKIDFLFIAVLTFIIITDRAYLSLCAVALILAHELGHIISARILKIPICEINFGAMSIDIEKPLVYHKKSFMQKMIIILSGFIFNLFLFIILSGIYIITKNEFIISVAVQSLVIGLVNLLPIESLDGGEAVDLLLGELVGYEKSKKISRMLSQVFLVSASVFGIFSVISSWQNVSFVMLVLYLIFENYFM